MEWSEISVTSQKFSKQMPDLFRVTNMGVKKCLFKLFTLNVCYSENQIEGQQFGIICLFWGFVWITETALHLVTRIHSHPGRDLDIFDYCIRIAHQPLLASYKA